MMYDRKVEVIIGSQSYSYPDYDIDFNISHITSEDPDVAEITLYNLTDTSVGAIVSNADVVVNAGYGDDVGTIFTGKVAQVLPEWHGVTKHIVVFATTIGSSFRSKSLDKTYQANTTASFIIEDLARNIGLSIGELSPVKDISYPQGKVVSGNVFSNIKKIATETGSKFYTKGRQVFIRPDKSAKESGVILNKDSGMIDSPSREEREEEDKKIVEYRIQSLLNHRVQKDTLVRVESRTINGTYRVIDVIHTSDFITEILIRP